MNKKILFSIVALSLVLSSGCNDDFLDRYPETNVTEANFFKTSSDLELSSTQFIVILSQFDMVIRQIIFVHRQRTMNFFK